MPETTFRIVIIFMLTDMDSALLDYRLYLFTLIYTGLSLSLAVISVFLPSIIRVLRYSGAKANLMTVPVYVTANICLIICAWISDLTQNRNPLIFAGECISGVGYLCWACSMIIMPVMRAHF